MNERYKNLESSRSEVDNESKIDESKSQIQYMNSKKKNSRFNRVLSSTFNHKFRTSLILKDSFINVQRYNIDPTIFHQQLENKKLMILNDISGHLIKKQESEDNKRNLVLKKIKDVKIFKKNTDDGQSLNFFFQFDGKSVYKKLEDGNYYDLEFDKVYIPLDMIDNSEFDIICEQKGLMNLIEKCKNLLKNYLEIGNRLFLSFKSSIDEASFEDYLTFLYDEKKIKDIKIKDLKENIDDYVEEIKGDFESKFLENVDKASSVNERLESLFKNDFFEEEALKKYSHFTIFHELISIQKTVFPSLFLRLNINNFSDSLENEDESNNIKESIFYSLMMKINNYFKIYFPLCCGILDLRDINYAKSPYIFCFDCNLLICNKCFLKHRNHKYFDIINSYKKKFANIHSNKNKFLNADPSKLKNIVDEYAEDLILKFIIYNLKSNINSKLKDVKNKDEVNITILDFLDIIIYDLLIKNIFPYALNQDDFKILKKNILKQKNK